MGCEDDPLQDPLRVWRIKNVCFASSAGIGARIISKTIGWLEMG